MIWNKKQVIEFLNKELWDKIYSCKELKETRSQAQNRLMWDWLRDISDTIYKENWKWYSPTQLHNWFKEMFIKTTYTYNKLTKKRFKNEKTTTTLNKKEFSQYLTDIDRYLFEFENIVVLKRTELREYN